MTTTAIEVRAPYDAQALALLQAEAEADAIALTGVTCEDDATYTALDGVLTEVLRRADMVEATKKTITGPLRAALKATDDLFRPLVAPLDACTALLKRAMGDHVQAKALAERQARALALEAAKAGDDHTMALALTTAEDVGKRAEAGARARFAWVVKRLIPDLLPDEYWAPDMVKISALAKAWPGASEDPPVVPGVVFEREARIAGSHK